MAKIDKLKEKYGVKHHASVAFMNRLDPTKNKKYLEWLFKMRYTKIGDKYTPNEDFPTRYGNKVEFYLAWRERNSQRMADDIKDINTFKSIKSFMDTMKPIAVLSREDVKKEVKVVFEDDNWKVIVPHSISASKVYGRGTKWCTTGPTYFRQYKDYGELYYIINKGDNRKFGLPLCTYRKRHMEDLQREEFYDNEDDCLSYGTIERRYGEKLPWGEAIVKDFKG